MHANPPLSDLFHEELYFFTTPVIVVLPKPWDDYGKDEQALLEKILTSVKMNLDAIHMVVQPSVELNTLLLYSPAKVLIFGCEVYEDIPLYKETAAHGFTMIRADDLTQLDDQRKKSLWIALRQMFGI